MCQLEYGNASELGYREVVRGAKKELETALNFTLQVST